MISEEIKNIITTCLRELDLREVIFEVFRPTKTEMGDYSSNVAMILARAEKKSPEEITYKIREKLSENEFFESVTVAGPGFLNFKITNARISSIAEEAYLSGDNFGKVTVAKEKINIEYVSANPTGPLHIGNARGGPIGMALANLYKFLGHDVVREFYINDIGGQIDKLGESIYYWYEKNNGRDCELPEGGYRGDYVNDIEKEIEKKYEKELKDFKNKEEFVNFFKVSGVSTTVGWIKRDLKEAGIEFDVWRKQSDIENEKLNSKIIDNLTEGGFTTKREGAVWFRPNSKEDELVDNENVLIKSDDGGTPTYFADDIAYHKDKFDRGSEILIDIWGSNHHGHIERMKQALSALKYNPDNLWVILYQMVRLKNMGESFSMSKRAGNIVTLHEVLSAGVSPDAFKFFILWQNSNTPFDFDVSLAAEQSEKNPVFYVKYAHARICSVLRRAGYGDEEIDGGNLGQMEEEEINLAQEILTFPEVVMECAKSTQIQKIAQYSYQLAGSFHRFYSKCTVIGDNREETARKLKLIKLTSRTIKTALNICGIEAPDKM